MKTIFIVDDNETNRVAARQALDAFYKTYALPSAEKMFQLSHKIQPDLILLDVDMPGIDGLETVRFIRADERLASVPILMFSAYAFDDIVKSCVAAGANGFVAKPFTREGLLGSVAKLTKGY